MAFDRGVLLMICCMQHCDKQPEQAIEQDGFEAPLTPSMVAALYQAAVPSVSAERKSICWCDAGRSSAQMQPDKRLCRLGLIAQPLLKPCFLCYPQHLLLVATDACSLISNMCSYAMLASLLYCCAHIVNIKFAVS